MCILKTKTKKPHKDGTHKQKEQEFQRLQDTQGTQLYGNTAVQGQIELLNVTFCFLSRKKKGYRVKHFKLFFDRNLMHN